MTSCRAPARRPRKCRVPTPPRPKVRGLADLRPLRRCGFRVEDGDELRTRVKSQGPRTKPSFDVAAFFRFERSTTPRHPSFVLKTRRIERLERKEGCRLAHGAGGGCRHRGIDVMHRNAEQRFPSRSTMKYNVASSSRGRLELSATAWLEGNSVRDDERRPDLPRQCSKAIAEPGRTQRPRKHTSTVPARAAASHRCTVGTRGGTGVKSR